MFKSKNKTKTKVIQMNVVVPEKMCFIVHTALVNHLKQMNFDPYSLDDEYDQAIGLLSLAKELHRHLF